MPLTAAEAADLVDDLYEELNERCRRPRYAELDGYFRGKHPLQFASATWREFHGDRYRGFSDNWCQVVPSVFAERIEHTGFRLNERSGQTGMTPGEQRLADAWARNEMDSQSSQGFLTTAIAGTSAVMVWADPDDESKAEITWESPDQVIVCSEPGRPMRRKHALKTWCDDDVEFATLYTADEVWKFERPEGRRVQVVGGRTPGGLELPEGSAFSLIGEGGWEQRKDIGTESWPMSNPLGVVPFVEVPNRPLLGGRPISEIDGARAMQDSINLLWAYLFNAADHASMPARVVMGQEPPKIPILDDTGRKVGEKAVELKDLANSRILWLTGQNTSINQWEPAKLSVFTEVMGTAIRHMASQTRTPLHSLVGELTNVNGETVIAMDAGLVGKVREFEKHCAARIREIYRLVSLVEDQSLAEQCRLGTVLWSNAETRLQSQASDAALKDKQVGLSLRTILQARYGMDDQQIEVELDNIRAEQEDPQLMGALGKIAAAAGSPVPAPAAVAGAGA